MIQLDAVTLAELDEAAGEASISRSALARRAIEEALAQWRRRRELDRVVDSFRRRPQEENLIAPRAVRRRAWPG